MVNWDPAGKTAVSDEEVIRKEVNQKLYYIKYLVAGSNDFLTIATTRPETIMADAAICVNPNDERYLYLKGKTVFVPLINREIPVIEDEYVTMDFGTGCLKVTPAHDLNDYELGIKHKLPVIDILNDDGTLNDLAVILVGEDRFAARKKIAVLLDEAGHLDKVDDYKSQVGFSERTDAAIEPKLSLQWFCKMDEMAKPALEDVLNGDVKLIPEKFVNTYRHWMENVRDWNISRQLWWGQQIPAWYGPHDILSGTETDSSSSDSLKVSAQHVEIAKTRVEAEILFTNHYKKSNLIYSDETIKNQLKHIYQDPDVMDTWFSSWLWPISVFDGFKNPDNKDINYYYPTNDLVTAPEILFFWVARMIMAGHEFRGQKPFTNVYLTGIVRDKLGRKMSKSLGNSPDPIGLIEKYGADGVRVGMLLCSPAGNDLMFDESYCEQGRNFANKIWNAFRLVKGWEVDGNLENPNQQAILWFENRFNEALAEIEDNFKQYRLSEALMACYKLVWDDFCAWYLEMIKPDYQRPIDADTIKATTGFFKKILTLLHPFMPFLTEELWHDELFGHKDEMDCCIVANYPVSKATDAQLLKEVEVIKGLIAEIRNVRNTKQITLKESLPLAIKLNSSLGYEKWLNIVFKLANISQVEFVNDKIPGAVAFLVGNDEFFIHLNESIDVDAERERLSADLVYLEGFLRSVNAKLSNERFVQNAKPDIIQNERNKKADAEGKIKIIEESLAVLG